MKRSIRQMLKMLCNMHPFEISFRKFGRELLRASYRSDNFDISTNGERWLIDKVSLGTGAIFDVGANIGTWSKECLSANPQADIYCVEPIPEFADSVKTNLGSRVTLIDCALSDSSKKVKIYKAGGGGKAGMLGIEKKQECREIFAATGDSVVRDFDIGRVSFLKIDADGFDLKILYGFDATIDVDRPVIQFEYSHFWIATNSLLFAAYQFLQSKSYVVGLLKKNKIDFKEYSPSDEVFINMNFVAVPIEKKHLVK